MNKELHEGKMYIGNTREGIEIWIGNEVFDQLTKELDNNPKVTDKELAEKLDLQLVMVRMARSNIESRKRGKKS